jgi:medium-chain acyl-[acyl-carrier-protein] hydrolase
MSGYQKEYEVHYYQIDRNQEATPVSILHFLEDIAISHSEAVGLGVSHLLVQRIGWVLNRWLLKMDKYPKLGDKVVIKTWPSKFERFYGTREFCIQDAQGNLCGKASSLWIYLNLDKKRPMRIPAHFGEIYGLTEQTVIDEPFKEIPDWVHAQSEIKFHVRKSDIDTNGHVNNARYLEWMLEGIHKDLSLEYQLSELEIIYKKETQYGSDILSECQSFNSEPLEYSHRILDDQRNHELAVGRTTWRKRRRQSI